MELTNLKTGQLYARLRMPPWRDAFYFGYTHSINLTPVVDVIAINGDGFTLRETRFASYGVGMPDLEPGQTYTRTDEYIIIGNINRALGERIVTAVGAKTGNYIAFEYPPRVTYYLSDLAPDSAPVALTVKRDRVFR